jgi:hypothetical protein
VDSNQYKVFIESLGVVYNELDIVASPECLEAKAKLVSRYYTDKSIKTLCDYRSCIPMLGIVTESIVITIIFDYEKSGHKKSGCVLVSWKFLADVTKSEIQWQQVVCTIDNIFNKCKKILSQTMKADN